MMHDRNVLNVMTVKYDQRVSDCKYPITQPEGYIGIHDSDLGFSAGNHG
jgi:hypothetical protein